MATKNAGNFVTTIPLRTTPRDRSMLRKRMEMARQAHNALLGECLKRVRQMRESLPWRTAKAMKPGKERTAIFQKAKKDFKFGKYSLYPFIREIRDSEIGRHLDSRVCMAIAARVFRAVECHVYEGGFARFRRRGEVRSVEGIDWESPLHWKGIERRIVWGKALSLPALIDESDPVHCHALKHRVVYSRIVRMVIRGKEHYYAQLVQEGEPYRKPHHVVGTGVVGLDIGPSTIAIVSDQSASLERFCNSLKDRNAEIRRCQRQESRKRFINNPDNFVEGGKTVKKGAKKWKVSRRQARLAKRRAELQRREQEHRKNLHGQLVHKVIASGSDIRTEKVSYKSFQRNFGTSVRTRAPGMFVARLKQVAEKAGATVTEFPTRTTCLSQTCPKCGTMRKKKLSERWHECSCGASVDRDISSAFLARHVVDGKLDTSAARKAWVGDCIRLRAVSGGASNSATAGASARSHHGVDRGRAGSHADSRRKAVSVPVGPKGNEVGKKQPEGETTVATPEHQCAAKAKCKCGKGEAMTTIETKERPIILGAEAVRAILEGRKTQHRVVVKPQPKTGVGTPVWQYGGEDWEKPESHWVCYTVIYDDYAGGHEADGPYWSGRCPFGKAGHVLWVRESLKLGSEGGILYAADGEPVPNWEEHFGDKPARKTLPPPMMPRWASRLSLRLTAVGVERLQDISEEDAKAEGAERMSSPSEQEAEANLQECGYFTPHWEFTYTEGFRQQWESIHGTGSWDRNEWVWKLAFERI